MPAYKIYILDAQGVRSPGNAATCETEAEVRELAWRMLPDGNCKAEIWDGDNLVDVVASPNQKDLDKLMQKWRK